MLSYLTFRNIVMSIIPFLQGEKAFAEREIKRLHGQKTLLERGISKQDSIASKRRDSTVERSSKVFDRKRAKSSFALSEQKMQVSEVI